MKHSFTRLSELSSRTPSQSVYISKELQAALKAYRGAGHNINVSKIVQQVLVDRFIAIEKGRRIIGDPFLFTPVQLANMKIKYDKDEDG